MVIKNIAMHHSGGLLGDPFADTQKLPWQHINNAHQARWGFLSNLGFYGGYNFYVDYLGNVKQFRQIGEETAAQLGHNLDTISICVGGNFINQGYEGVTARPTEAQKKAVIDLLTFCVGFKDYKFIPSVVAGTVIDIDESRIHHHGFYGKTECDCLPDNYWSNEFKEAMYPRPTAVETQEYVILTKEADVNAIIAVIIRLLQRIQLLWSGKFGSSDKSHCGDL